MTVVQSKIETPSKIPTAVAVRSMPLVLWAQRIFILSVVLFSLLIATIILSFITPVYTAQTLTLIETSKTYGTRNEVEVLHSTTFVKQIIEKLSLMNDPEFNRRLDHKSNQNKLREFKTLSVYGSELEKLPSEMVDRQMADIILNVQRHLHVRQVPHTYAIEINFSSFDPVKAALIANSFADFYASSNSDDIELSELQQKFQISEKNFQNYMSQNGIENNVEQIAELKAQLTAAQYKHDELKTKFDHFKDALKNPEKTENIASSLESGLITKLRIQQSDLANDFSQLASRYGPKHPKIIKIKAAIEDIKRSIRHETRVVLENMEDDVAFASKRVTVLRQGLADIEQGGNHGSDPEKFKNFKKSYDDAKFNLQSYLQNHPDQASHASTARVVSYAVVPQFPSYPNKAFVIVVCTILSFLSACLIVLFKERFKKTYRSATHLEATLGFPCYALIPSVKKTNLKDLGLHTIAKPSSTVSESVRTLRLVLNLRRPKDQPRPKVITITSSLPGEGKTTLSLWMARLAAKSGEKVVVIDCDLRRSRLHTVIGKTNEVSLVEYLTGQKDPDKVIQKDEESGAHVIYGRPVPNTALDLLNSDKMRKLVESLRQVYDLVILDAPACLAVSDARVLAGISDHLIYAVGWNRTSRAVVTSGVKQFSDMHYEKISFVLTNVDVKQYARFSYGDTVYYYGRYKEYYAS